MTLVPYFHREVLLERLWDLKETYRTLASNLDAAANDADLTGIGNQVEKILTQIASFSTKIQAEKKRRMLKSIFWPALAVISFSFLLGQIAFGSINLAVAGTIVFLIGFGLSLVLVALGPVLARLRTMERKARIRFVGVMLAIPVALGAIMFLSDVVQGRAVSAERLPGVLTFAAAFASILMLSFLGGVKKSFL